MSYNVTRWKVKKLDNLCIPLASFYKHPRKDWHPEREDLDDDGSVLLVGLEGTRIRGQLQDGIVRVEEIECRSEGSGVFMDWILLPALKDSTGELVVSLIWEGGDRIQRMTAKDGAVAFEDIEL